MQKEHILLHPLIIERYAETLFLFFLTGVISAYVSSALRRVFIWNSSYSNADAMSLGKSRYASGPQTTWTPSLNIFSFSLSAIQPSIPTILLFLTSLILWNIFYYADSRIAHVFKRTIFASFSSSVYWYFAVSTDRIIYESFIFIWHPYV